MTNNARLGANSVTKLGEHDEVVVSWSLTIKESNARDDRILNLELY